MARICGAGDKRELQEALLVSIRSLGFDGFNLSYEKDVKREFMTDPTFTNWSYQDLVVYEKDGWADKDPLLEYAAIAKDPLYWRADAWQDDTQPEYLDYIRSVGVHGGITVPIIGTSEKIGALTLLSFANREHDEDVLHAASIIGMVAKARAAAIGLATGQAPGSSAKFRTLSTLQREVLKWIASGKSNVEIAVITGQSKRSIDYHVIEILKKLEVRTRAQAAAIFASI